MSAEIDTQAWIEAGLKELASGGVGGVRVEVLAQRLGVTKGGFYRRFKDRRALLNAVLDEWGRGRISAINRLREQSEGQAPSERLSSVARHYTERLSVQRSSLPYANGREPIPRQPLLAQALMKRVSNWPGSSIAIWAFRLLSLESGRYFFTHFCLGKACCLSTTGRASSGA
jgi:AcrR family transcriptional regulator